MDPIYAAAFTEIAKLSLQAAFAAMKQAGLTEEEKDALYSSEKERFLKNVAQDLPEV